MLKTIVTMLFSKQQHLFLYYLCSCVSINCFLRFFWHCYYRHHQFRT